MDVHDLWQENKRWILGVLIGGVVFWIGTLVVGAWFDSSSVRRNNQKLAAEIGKEEFYSAAARTTALEEADALAKVRNESLPSLLFQPGAQFVLDGKGLPDVHFDQVSREVRRRLLIAADEAGVEVAENALRWAPPAGEQIGRALVALNLLEQGVQRLIAAHEAVRKAGEGASHAFLAIDSFRSEAAAPQPGRGSKADATAPVQEERVAFTFRADAATLTLFLESLCTAPPIVLAPDFRVEGGKRSNDPLKVTGKLVALLLPARSE
jgi:hypothetical protein